MKSIFLLSLLLLAGPLSAQHHNPGAACSSCHGAFRLGGTVFTGYESDSEQARVAVTLYSSDGSRVTLPASDDAGRIFASSLADGRYLIRVGALRSRSWHDIPAQRDCNTCHIPGGNLSSERDLQLWALHTDLPESNNCTPCHHYPASMQYGRLATPGQLTGNMQPPVTQESGVIIRGQEFTFRPGEHAITSIRPDIFAEGYYSLFDVLLSIAAREGIRIAYHWDDDCQTHFIDSMDGTEGEFWYGFSYDAGSSTQNELRYRRQIRWDELLWQPGSWIRLSTGDDLDELKREFREEITREREFGHLVPIAQIAVNPSNYQGNPPESNRITVTRTFRDVQVTAHDHRAAGKDSLYRMPFRAGAIGDAGARGLALLEKAKEGLRALFPRSESTDLMIDVVDGFIEKML